MDNPGTLPITAHRRMMLQVMLSSVPSETWAPGWAYSPALSCTLAFALGPVVPASAVVKCNAHTWGQGTWAFQEISGGSSTKCLYALALAVQGQPQPHLSPSLPSPLSMRLWVFSCGCQVLCLHRVNQGKATDHVVGSRSPRRALLLCCMGMLQEGSGLHPHSEFS